MRSTKSLFSLCLVFIGGVVIAIPASAADVVNFQRDIKPILSNTCFRCHGPDPTERKGGVAGLRLDNPEGILADLGAGHGAVVPGKPGESEIVRRVTSTDPEEMMPPRGKGKRLTENEISLLKRWIQEGAKYTAHWSYIKPARPVPPLVKTPGLSQPIDQFLAGRLEREGLAFAPPADRRTLIRRVTCDLTGLPPTLEEVEQFVADPDPQAYEKLVNRLLANDAYGEYQAHQWLDLARYADSAGYADDPPRTIWLYRDYVIRSFNANKPFDLFTIEQLAGDLLPNATEEQRIATAFHRNTMTNNEGGTNDEEFRNVAVVDRVNTTMAVWMGTTIACAQCHTHKYDPLTQDEYFRMFAILNNTEDADRGDESPLLSILTDEQSKNKAGWEQELAQVDKTLATQTPEWTTARTAWEKTIPRDLAWQSLRPAVATRLSGTPAVLLPETPDVVQFAEAAATDTYTVEIPLSAATKSFRALRLESLSDPALPGQGPGLSGGNFVISRITASIIPATTSPAVTGRFLRVEIPGKGMYLHLAEVEAFDRAGENVARKGTATQISTDFGGDAARAIDGNTNGKYFEANSVTHTATADDPWWEVDLKQDVALDRVVLWNRTDGGVESRLNGAKIRFLNAARQPVWEQVVEKAPAVNGEYLMTGVRSIEFLSATADFAQSGFDPQQVIKNPDPTSKGWAIGGQTGRSHQIVLTTKSASELPADGHLVITIEHAAKFPQHLLGKFRLSLTADERIEIYNQIPPPVLAALNVPEAERSPEQQAAIFQHWTTLAPEAAAPRERQAVLKKSLAELKPITVPVLRELAEDKRRKTRVQRRGNYLEVGDEVTEGVPAVFPPLTPTGPNQRPTRLDLARWLVSPENPLTARVVANRYWEQIFGIGIVSTSEEFGNQGEQPFHPELLDWLATELVRVNWDIKAFVKTLVLSKAYQQSSKVSPELTLRDPENRLLAHGPRVRLSAEMVRDQALVVSGLLTSKLYGVPVKPPQPATGLSAAFGGGIDWQTSTGADRYRRALYTNWRRTNPYPSMTTFDAPNRDVCTVRRVRTNTPLQALVTLNDPVFVEAAQALARRMLREGGTAAHDQLEYGFKICTARPPRAEEIKALEHLYQATLERFQKDPAAAKRMATEPLGPVPANTDEPTAAALSVVSNILLNLDEMLMKR